MLCVVCLFSSECSPSGIMNAIVSAVSLNPCLRLKCRQGEKERGIFGLCLLKRGGFCVLLRTFTTVLNEALLWMITANFPRCGNNTAYPYLCDDKAVIHDCRQL